MGEGPDSQAAARAVQWAHRLGEQRHASDACAAQTAASDGEETTRTSALSLERWQAIVAGVKRLVDAYNAGAKRAVLRVVEQPDQPAVTITAGDEGAPYLTAVLEETLICIQARDSGGVAHASEVRLRPDRDNEATAAYVLQDWMQRL